MSRSRHWLVAGIFAILTFGIPLSYISAQPPEHPVVRVARTGQHFTGLFIEDNARMLIVTGTDRRSTRSAIGLLTRPWEPDIPTVVAPADDRVFPSIWDATRHPATAHVIIVGLPGREADWSRLETDLRERDVQLTYVSEPSRVVTSVSDVEVHPADATSGAHIRFQNQDATVVMMLDQSKPPDGQHALISNEHHRGSTAKLVILPASTSELSDGQTLLVQRDEVVTVVLEKTMVRVQGGRLIEGDSPAN